MEMHLPRAPLFRARTLLAIAQPIPAEEVAAQPESMEAALRELRKVSLVVPWEMEEALRKQTHGVRCSAQSVRSVSAPPAAPKLPLCHFEPPANPTQTTQMPKKQP
jgi:hypothetical protein